MWIKDDPFIIDEQIYHIWLNNDNGYNWNLSLHNLYDSSLIQCLFDYDMSLRTINSSFCHIPYNVTDGIHTISVSTSFINEITIQIAKFYVYIHKEFEIVNMSSSSTFCARNGIIKTVGNHLGFISNTNAAAFNSIHYVDNHLLYLQIDDGICSAASKDISHFSDHNFTLSIPPQIVSSSTSVIYAQTATKIVFNTRNTLCIDSNVTDAATNINITHSISPFACSTSSTAFALFCAVNDSMYKATIINATSFECDLLSQTSHSISVSLVFWDRMKFSGNIYTAMLLKHKMEIYDFNFTNNKTILHIYGQNIGINSSCVLNSIDIDDNNDTIVSNTLDWWSNGTYLKCSIVSNDAFVGNHSLQIVDHYYNETSIIYYILFARVSAPIITNYSLIWDAYFANIYITGSIFINSVELICITQSQNVSAVYINKHLIKCPLYPHDKTLEISVSNNNGLKLSNHLTVYKFRAHHLGVLSGATVGFTDIYFNINDVNSSLYTKYIDFPKCWFDEFSVELFVINSSTAICTAPFISIFEQNLSFSLEFGRNYYFFHGDMFVFELLYSPVIYSISPSEGPSAGGYNISIYGDNLFMAKHCYFNNITSISYVIVNKTTMFCEVPPLPAYNNIDYDVAIFIEVGIDHQTSVNNKSITSNRNQFIYLSTPHISSITPLGIIGSATDSTEPITIDGKNFKLSTELACLFNLQIVSPAIYVSSYKYLCDIPQSLSNNRFNVTFGGIRFFNQTFVNFSVEPDIKPFEFMNPVPDTTYAVTSYPKNITLSSSLLTSIWTNHIYCRYSDRFAPYTHLIAARIADSVSGSIFCPIPLYQTLRIKDINISIETRIPDYHIIFDSHIINTVYFTNPSIARIEPNATEENSLITIYGFGFQNHSNLSCKFNNYIVSAIFIHSKEIRCYVPNKSLVDDSYNVSVRVRYNGYDFTLNGYPFEYIDSIRNYTFHYYPKGDVFNEPKSIYITSRMHMKPLVTSYCMIESVLSFAVYHSPDIIECKLHQSSPIDRFHPNKMVQVSITQDFQQWYNLSDFTYYLMTPILSLSVESLSTDISTQVMIESMYFPHFNDTIVCQWSSAAQYDTSRDIAQYINSSHILCVAPKSAIAQHIAVKVFSNGVTSTLNHLIIIYNPYLSIMDINPEIIIEKKETQIMISARGSSCYDFYSTQMENILCNFDDNFTEYSMISSMVYDETLNVTNITCLTPLLPNYGDSSSRLRFWLTHFETKEIISSIWSHGIFVISEPLILSLSIDEGPTASLPIDEFNISPQIMITGQHFYPFIDPHCKFIQIATNQTSIVSAKWRSNTSLTCIVRHAGNNMSLTMHYVQIIIGQHRNSSQFNITYNVGYDPQITKIYSLSNNDLLILGLYFKNTTDLQCGFGRRLFIVNATFINSSAIICSLPAITAIEQIIFDVAVTTNGVRWSTASQSIHSSHNFDNKYLSFSDSNECQIGYRCKHDMDFQHMQCFPGQFLLDSKCTDCVPPFYCPNGVDIVSCPKGKICSKFQLDSPVLDCPPSMICDLNTMSHKKPFLFDLWNDTLILRGKYQDTINYNSSSNAECISIIAHEFEYISLDNVSIHSSTDCILSSTSSKCHNITIISNQSDIINKHLFVFWNLDLVLLSLISSIDDDSDGQQSFSFSFCRPNEFFPIDVLQFYQSNFANYHNNKSWSYSASNTSFIVFDFDEFMIGAAHPCFMAFFCTQTSVLPLDAARCPSGSYCPQYQSDSDSVIVCPQGALCPFAGMAYFEICRAGTYNALTEQRYCSLCPSGFVCSSPAMITPYLCPAGSICDTHKLIYPKYCPAGYWCDVGTNVSAEAYECPFGTYCDIGGITNDYQLYKPIYYNHSFSYSSIATYPIYNYNYSSNILLDITSSLLYPAICPLGFICSNATINLFINNESWCTYGTYCNGTNKYIADPGYFVELHQSFMQKPCEPRSFTPDFGSRICSITPSGFMNPKANATYAESCKKGHYRNNDEAVFCIGCKNGFWSPQSRISDETLCEKCPAGRVCGMTGTYNMSSTSPCLEGYVCGFGTFVEIQFDVLCPRGFSCGFETTPLTQYDNPCNYGYYCNIATALSSQYNQRCPRYYYCPYGTYIDGKRLLPDSFERGLWSLFSQTNYVANIQTTCEPMHKYNHRYTTPRAQCGDYVDVIALPQNSSNLNYTRIKHRCPYGTTTATNKYLYQDCEPMLQYLVLARVDALDLVNINYVNLETYSVIIDPLEVFHFEFKFENKYDIQHNINYSFIIYNQTESKTDSNQLIFSDNVLNNANVNNSNSSVKFTLSSTKRLEFNLSIEILHGRTLFLLSNLSKSVRVHKTSPSRNDVGTRKAFFAWIDEWQSDIELPLNLPKHSYFISHSPSAIHELHDEPFSAIRTVSATRKSKARYWLLPYVPFFSNCVGFGSYIYFNDLFESEKYCSLMDAKDTIPIKSFAMFTSPKSDTCNALLHCRYEEDLSYGSNKKIWFSHLSITRLFYMIAAPLDYDEVNMNDIISHYDESDKLEVVVSRDDDNGHFNLQSDIPRDIIFDLQYHQLNNKQKRIISASILLSNFSSWSDGNKYRLNINWIPMNYYDLINHFAYDIDIYLVLFVLIAAIQIIIYWIILMLHFISRRYQLKIEIRKFCRKFFEPLTISTLFVLPGIIILLLLIKLIFCTKYISSVKGYFGEYAITWLDIIPHAFEYSSHSSIDDFNSISLTATGGRVGVAFIAIACFILYYSMYIIMPQKQWKERQRDVTDGLDYFESLVTATKHVQQPMHMIWKRTYWIFHAMITIILSTVIVELSLSPIFEAQFYPIFVAIKLSQLVFNRIFTDSLKEDLLISPFTLSLESAVFAATLSAPDFITFVLGHFIDIFITILEGLYWEPVIDWFLFFIQKHVQKVSAKQQSQSELESISSVVGVTSAHIEKFIACIICILFIFILILFRDETALAPSYGIKAREMLFYELFAVVMIIPTILSSIIMINIQGLLYGWNVFNYLEYCQYRYSQRITRWIINNPHSDLSIDTTSRSTHDLCFSSQYYLILLFAACGLLFALIGIQSFVRHNYSPFGDILFFPIFIFVLFMCYLLMRIHLFVANLFEIYVLKYHYEIKEAFEAPDIEYLTPLQRVNRAKEQYKNEYQQIQTASIVTDHFRTEFLKHNRNFIGDHIHSIVTTKMIKKHSNVSIIQLAKVLGLTRNDDDDDDEDDKDNISCDIHMDDIRLIVIAKYVLAVAKRRLLFKSALNKYVSNTLNLTQCNLCKLKNKKEIKTDIHFDVISIDFALEQFRKQYISATKGIDPLHPKIQALDKECVNKWIQFMMEDIGYEILCEECFEDKLEDQKQLKTMHSFSPTTKQIATLFLKLAKQKTSETQNIISVSSNTTISISDDDETEETQLQAAGAISSDSIVSNRSVSISNRSFSLSSLSTITDSESFTMHESYPDLPHNINENVRNLVRAWCWIATLKYEKQNQ